MLKCYFLFSFCPFLKPIHRHYHTLFTDHSGYFDSSARSYNNENINRKDSLFNRWYHGNKVDSYQQWIQITICLLLEGCSSKSFYIMIISTSTKTSLSIIKATCHISFILIRRWHTNVWCLLWDSLRRRRFAKLSLIL